MQECKNLKDWVWYSFLYGVVVEAWEWEWDITVRCNLLIWLFVMDCGCFPYERVLPCNYDICFSHLTSQISSFALTIKFQHFGTSLHHTKLVSKLWSATSYYHRGFEDVGGKVRGGYVWWYERLWIVSHQNCNTMSFPCTGNCKLIDTHTHTRSS